jgi:hypothetical protein
MICNLLPFDFFAMLILLTLIRKLKFHTGIDPFALQFFQVRIDPQLVDGPQGSTGDFQGHPFAGFRDEKSFFMQVRRKDPLRLSV